MEKNRQTKLMTIVTLLMGVAIITLGFATFSARLNIISKAKVTSAADSFKVVLSKSNTEEIIGTIPPTGNGDEAIISNKPSPTISNLKASFTNPGEKVVYEFYAINIGYLDAFLNKIEFNNVASTDSNKVCRAGAGTTNSYVQNACNSIRVTINVDDDDKACQTSTYAAHKLGINANEKIIVTIEYDSIGARADGPFEVQFGDITLNYSTVDLETKNVPICTPYDTHFIPSLYAEDKTNVEDLDNDGKISLSDKVTLGTESFYVMSTNERTGTITMLAEWNLNIGSNPVSG